MGFDLSQAPVAKYMRRSERPPSQSWRTFLTNHLQQISAADFFVVPTATCRLLFVLVILAHERRRVVHVAVTDHPTSAWTVQQLREAFPFDAAPRYLIHDHDTAFQAWATATSALGIEEVLTAVRSPWQNAYVEYYLRSRTHLALSKDAPVPRPAASNSDDPILEVPCVGGLHHRYERCAA